MHTSIFVACSSDKGESNEYTNEIDFFFNRSKCAEKTEIITHRIYYYEEVVKIENLNCFLNLSFVSLPGRHDNSIHGTRSIGIKTRWYTRKSNGLSSDCIGQHDFEPLIEARIYSLPASGGKELCKQ